MLIDTEKVRALVPFDGTIEEHADLSIIIEMVEAAVESFLGRKLQENYFFEQFICPEGPTKMVFLNALPIQKIFCVVDEENRKIEDFEITHFGLHLSKKEKRCRLWISYEGGLNFLPTDIKRAILLQTITEIKQRDYIGIPISSDSNGYSVTIPEIELTKETKRILRIHQHPEGLRSLNQNV